MIRSICFDAESGVFPHPSADAQILYGRNCVALQVCPTAFLACFIVLCMYSNAGDRDANATRHCVVTTRTVLQCGEPRVSKITTYCNKLD